MEDENKLIKERKDKLARIRELNIDPYPYSFDVKHKSSELLEKFDKLKPEEHSKSKAIVAGRIMQIRKMGKAAFAHIQDDTGKIQIYFRKDDLGEKFTLFKLLDIGDIIGVEGSIFKTKTGEVTIYAKDVQILCKSLRPFPEKYHGLKDEEIRYRKRYLDLTMNPEIKEIFKKKSRIISKIRQFLDNKEFVEVQTPILQTQYGGANARPFVTHINAWDMKMYLKIAPELYLKKLLIGGIEKVYDLNYSFRNEGSDKTHNPEFLMVEYYWAYTDREKIIEMTEELWEWVAKEVNGSTKIKINGNTIDFKRPWKRFTMKEALVKHAKIDIDKFNDKEIQDIMRGYNVEYEGDFDRNVAMTLLFEELVEDKLIQPTHILDHPAITTPLCKKTKYDDNLVERTEFYVNGWECGNGYSELNDPVKQRELFQIQVEKGRGGDEEAHPMDEEFIEAMEYGMPPAGGLGFGIDRMCILFTEVDSIRDIILFPTMKPKEENKND